MTSQQIRTFFFRYYFALIFTPFCDFGVISAQQYRRNGKPHEFGRSRIMRIFEIPLRKTLLVGGSLAPQYVGNISRDGVYYDE